MSTEDDIRQLFQRLRRLEEINDELRSALSQAHPELDLGPAGPLSADAHYDTDGRIVQHHEPGLVDLLQYPPPHKPRT